MADIASGERRKSRGGSIKGRYCGRRETFLGKARCHSEEVGDRRRNLLFQIQIRKIEVLLPVVEEDFVAAVADVVAVAAPGDGVLDGRPF